MEDSITPRKPSESISEMIQMVLPNEANTLGSLFGGKLMSWIDLVASVAAKRHCRRTVVTVSMDRLDFKSPARVGDLVVLNAQVNRAFRTSMEVGVNAFTENLRTGERIKTASAYLTFVALDDDGKPAPVPPVEPETEEEKRRFTEAGMRRKRRISNP